MPLPAHFPTLTSLVARGFSPARVEAQDQSPLSSTLGNTLNGKPVITLVAAGEYSPVLQCQAATSIQEFREAEWNALVPLNEPQLRWDFLRATEKSGLATGAAYLAIRGPHANGSTPALLGVAVVYRKDIDLLTLASPKLTRFADAIRHGPLKRFLIVRALSCGPVINNCRSNFWVAPEIENALSHRVAQMLLKQIKALRGGALQVLFELGDEAATHHGQSLQQSGFIRGASLPGTRLDVQWENFETYLSAMRKFYRRAVRADQKAAQDLDVEIVDDFSHLADEACALYQKTLERASVVMERLTPEFFRELACLKQARLVTIREKSSAKLLGIEVLILTQDGVQDLYTGIDYEFNEKYNLYFNLAYPGIALACENNWSSVSMGQTSYTFKSRLGVESYPLHVFVRHRNPLVHWVLGRARNQIFPATPVPTHHVFHEVEVASA